MCSYVGTLHEINSDNSTVALEQVVSYGTEDRRPDDEIAPSLDNIYEYIVFRGSDVKDLRIEGGPAEHEAPKPPPMPDDPAIVGVSLGSLLVKFQRVAIWRLLSGLCQGSHDEAIRMSQSVI